MEYISDNGTTCPEFCCRRRSAPTKGDNQRCVKTTCKLPVDNGNSFSTHFQSRSRRQPAKCGQSFDSSCRILSQAPRLTSLPAFSTIILLCLSIANCVDAFSIVKSECDPDDIFSCGFGAICDRVYGRSHTTMLGKPVYRCKCPDINCREAGLLDPVCGTDGKQKTTYFNDLCLMMDQCENQRPIKRVCYGGCKQASCKAITSETAHHSPCPRENVGLCLNGGLCIHHRASNESFCRCPSGYHGDRCQLKRMQDVGTPKPCNTTQQILTIFAVILLAVVLLSVVTCMCWRNSKSKKDHDGEDKLWSRTNTDIEETTPLRESARSDYMFPSRDRLGGGSAN